MNHVFTPNPLFVDQSVASKLGERLFLSGSFVGSNPTLLRMYGINTVVNLTNEYHDVVADSGEFKVLCLGLEDAEEIPFAALDQFLTYMESFEQLEEVVLIHCHAGISRTAAFAIAWLMHLWGADAESDLRSMWSAAEDLVKMARPIIQPHYKLKKSVLEFFSQRNHAAE